MCGVLGYCGENLPAIKDKFDYALDFGDVIIKDFSHLFSFSMVIN